MKFFKKLMAGAMALAMLSAYTVAFAAGSDYVTGSGGGEATVSGAGSYVGSVAPVFKMKMPTAAANTLLAFTVDPNESVKASPPENSIPTASGGSTYGTVLFKTTSGSATPNTIYKDESTPLKVTNLSSVDVTVNMFATVSETKMTLSTTSGFTGTNEDKAHLYLAVKVSTMSGAVSTVSGSGADAVSVVTGGTANNSTQVIKALGAKQVTVLKTVSENFKNDGTSTPDVRTTTASGGKVDDDYSWNSVEYTVVGTSNPNANWKIKDINAPALTIKWMVDANSEVTYPINTPSATSYTAMLDKDAYKAGDTVTLYIKPNNATAKPSGIKLKYVALKATDGTMDSEKSIPFTLNTTKVNGVYSATGTIPTDMASMDSPKGNVSTYKAPTWELSVS